MVDNFALIDLPDGARELVLVGPAGRAGWISIQEAARRRERAATTEAPHPCRFALGVEPADAIVPRSGRLRQRRGSPLRVQASRGRQVGRRSAT